MKYFKHKSNLRNEEALQYLTDAMGAEGYGLYLMVLEIVSEQSDGVNVSYTRPVKHWCHLLLLKSRKKLFRFLENIREYPDFCRKMKNMPARSPLFDWVQNGEFVTITIPHLKQIQDEYTAKKAKYVKKCIKDIREKVLLKPKEDCFVGVDRSVILKSGVNSNDQA